MLFRRAAIAAPLLLIRPATTAAATTDFYTEIARRAARLVDWHREFGAISAAGPGAATLRRLELVQRASDAEGEALLGLLLATPANLTHDEVERVNATWDRRDILDPAELRAMPAAMMSYAVVKALVSRHRVPLPGGRGGSFTVLLQRWNNAGLFVRL